MINSQCRLYLRASTKDQDEQRARFALEQFATQHQLTIIGVYADSISGTKIDRPGLAMLLDEAQPGDVLLCESVDRLSRLTRADWRRLRQMIEDKGMRLVVVDLPTTHLMIGGNDATGQIFSIINDLLLDLMATQARIEQEKRVERIREGLANKKRRGEPVGGKGRNRAKWAAVERRLRENLSMADIAKLCDVGIATVYRIRAELNNKSISE
ncbi:MULTISPECIES: recombinase family protein [Pseudomonas]|uniref:Recombinase family protein n=1 Tax=Pseudomonas juntendi TaxID=2666183 RepID=A0A7W2JND1_9PSED|nr:MULTISPECIES: recombinase family protein [Pseudomonas]MBA6062147.1 recombinase family protein [Pseudomonas juntendi]MBA6123149.1 recombinase family protein [Pseudomonas juntendi]MBA6128750.1 recombinase family protein [Pseudomonas juntendi]MBA6140700.1 recombinase family protein [Pseudomonas monteilii]